MAFAPAGARADGIKDAKLNAYVRYGDANVRIDKIESARHVDGNPIVDPNMNADDGNGYLIVSLSVQNPGSAEIFMPALSTILFLEDQSKVEGAEIRGPYVGAKTTEAPGRLSPKESIRVRYVVPSWPGTRVTKLVLDPNNGAPQLRFQIGANDITPLAEIPRPKAPE
ncbi:MAG: hypothetical protein NVSMB64_28390 [Candidatus Velthaea sp.]